MISYRVLGGLLVAVTLGADEWPVRAESDELSAALISAQPTSSRNAGVGPSRPSPELLWLVQSANSVMGARIESDADLERARQLLSTPVVLPVEGRISSPFGRRRHPVLYRLRDHAGIDIVAPHGTPIVAAADGVVTTAGNAGGYGLLVEITHGSGVRTRYAHASKLLTFKGQSVRRGQVIARVGATGLATGPHVHYEVRTISGAIDPTRYGPGR